MADDEHLAVLRQGVSAWNEWRDRHPQVEPDLSRIDLRDQNFTGCNFRGTNFTRSDLSMTSLDRSVLAHVVLHRAIVTGMNFSGLNLRNADISAVNLTGSNLSGADLYSADLTGSRLNKADLSGASLRGATLFQADIRGADLRGTDLRDTNVAGVIWDRATMKRKYRGVRGIESCYGDALFKRAAADQDFLDTLEAKWASTWRRWLYRAWGMINYGQSLLRVGLLVVFLIALFGEIYTLCPVLIDSTKPRTWFTPFYFSIVTYTTLGFGEITPATWLGEVIVSTEVVLGYLSLGLLLSVLAEKIARRS